jgi:signal transduction histidine kinase
MKELRQDNDHGFMQLNRRINTHSLRWLGVIGPMLFWLGVLLFETAILRVPVSWPASLVELAFITAGSILFANWVASSLEWQQKEVRRRSEHLVALRDASLALTNELDLANVLQRVVDLSRTLVDARYGALAVLDIEGRSIAQFYTSGLTPEQRNSLGTPPAGHGVLGIMTREGKAVRIDDIAAHQRAGGFPAQHPHMRSLLGVPIMARGRIFGNLYLADKRVASDTGATVVTPFTAEEQEILQMFAAQVAIAIENAQLYRENQQLAVLRERDRIGMDLHDGVIQSLYAVGLLLDDARHRLDSDPEKTRSALATAISGLNNTIQDIRNYISDLRPHRFQGRNVKQGLEQLARELRTDTLFVVQLKVDPQAAAACTARQADEFLHIAQEALANIRKHADATTIQMRFQFSDGLLQMVIQDDGSGFDPVLARTSFGNGLRNMRERARALHGEFRLDSHPGEGTQVIVMAPIEKRDA